MVQGWGWVYVAFALLIGVWIWRRERHSIDGLGLVLSAMILAMFPTLLVWAVFAR